MNPRNAAAPGGEPGAGDDQVGTGSRSSVTTTDDIPADLTRPYEAAWRLYWDAGWRGVITLPPRRKIPPPDDYTGHAGIDPSFADCTAWAEDRRPHNLGLRLPATVIGADKDCWDGKTGDQSIAAKEAEWGPLPKTYRSTSRGFDTGNGIWLYGVPEGTVLTEKPLADVEIIQRHHRYVVCWPSIHPNGGRYEWLDERTGEIVLVPDLANIPELPAAWVEGLRSSSTGGHAKADLGGDEVAEVLKQMPGGQPCLHMREVAGKVIEDDGRHNTYRDAQLAVVGAGRRGCPGAGDTLTRLRRMFLAQVTHPDQDPAHRRTKDKAADEWAVLLAGAVKIVVADQPEQGEDCTDAPAVPAWETNGQEQDTDLWDERDWLTHLRAFARSRMVSPLALLGVYLVRVAANVPPWVTLPPIVGGKGSLNLFCALVGPSGGGKGAAVGASDELLPWADHWDHPGSGEGILHLFVARQQVDDPDNPGHKKSILHQHTHQATLLVDEVDTLTALGSRQGANLLPTMRTAWSGGDVGFGYADPAKRLKLQAHTYRLGLVVGAQPERCGPLFDDADGGTPQRFIWAPLIDPGAPDIPPEDPGPLSEPIQWARTATQIEVPDTVAAELRGQRLGVLRTGDTGGLDGHAQLNRLKIAAVVAISEGSTAMTVDDWVLAGRIQQISDNTRAWIQRKISAAAQTQQDQRTAVRTKQAVAVDEAVDSAKTARAARTIANRVHRDGGEPVAPSAARKALASGARDYFEPGLDLAVKVGWVVVEKRPHPTNGSVNEVLLPGKEKP